MQLYLISVSVSVSVSILGPGAYHQEMHYVGLLHAHASAFQSACLNHSDACSDNYIEDRNITYYSYQVFLIQTTYYDVITMNVQYTSIISMSICEFCEFCEFLRVFASFSSPFRFSRLS